MCNQCGGNCEACQMMTAKEQEEVAKTVHKFVDKWKNVKGNLMMVLHDVQQEKGYVPRAWALELAKQLGIPLARFYEVLTFYHYFKLKPQGKHNISVCLGTACYLKGSENIVKAIQQKLKISEGETTPDGFFHLDIARCLGACGLAPVTVIDGQVYGKGTPEKILEVLKGIADAEGVDFDQYAR